MRRAPVSRWWNNCLQEPWNHNLHYHRVIVNVIPPDCRRALDVGCGLGALTRDLRRSVPEVAGFDRDERSIALARAHAGAGGVGYVRGDFQAAPIRPGSVDLITSVASLHHMEAAAGLRQMADLLRPGGTLVVVGLARSTSLADAVLVLAAAVGHRVHMVAGARRRRLHGGSGTPDAAYTSPVVWPPPLSYRQARRLAERVLPGVRYRRRLYWRYTLIWIKPTSGLDDGRSLPTQ
jgi:SAM-dependent methyltransferase